MAGQGMHQTQNLALQHVLSPQLQQSLLILQTPLLELRNLVQQEMETNPVLEDLPDEPGADERSEAEPSSDDNFKDEFEKLASLDEEWRDYMAQSASYRDGFRDSKEAQDKRQFLFDSCAGNASAEFDWATESERAQRQRSQRCRANHWQCR